MTARYLVTGGAGFIGSNLVDILLKEGHRVRVLDNFETGKAENLKDYLQDIELIEGDVRDANVVVKAMQGVDYALHQAALGSVPRSVADPQTTNDVNINGTLNLLLAARDAGVQKLVFASSSSIYGPTEALPKHEAMPPNPASPYALSKYTAEKYCQLFTELYGLPTVCLRYFNIFGPRQDPSSQYAAVIPLFINALLSAQAPTIYGDGEQTRDFTFIDNAVEANLLAATAERQADGKIFNIACGQRISINALFDLLKRIEGVDVQPLYSDPRAGDVRHSLADISQATSLLQYAPQINLEDGLQKTMDWYKAQASIAS